MPVVGQPITSETVSTPTRELSGWAVVEPAQGRICSDVEVAAHLRVEMAGDDGWHLLSLVDAATDYAEDAMECSLLPRTIRATFSGAGPHRLPRGPILEIQSITDATGRVVTGYATHNVGHATFVTPPAGLASPVSILYRAGYANADRIPAAIRLAILAHVGTLYEARESTTDKPRTAVPHHLEAFYRLKRRGTGVG